MVKIFSCLTSVCCVAGITTVTVFNSAGGIKNTGTKNSVTVSNEERKVKFLRELGEKDCHVVSSVGQEEKQFGAIYICSKDLVAPPKKVEDGREPMYYLDLEEENSFNELDSTKSPESLFKKIKKFQYKKGESGGPNYILLELSDGTTKQILADSWEGWNLYGGFSTDEEDGETFTEILTGDTGSESS